MLKVTLEVTARKARHLRLRPLQAVQPGGLPSSLLASTPAPVAGPKPNADKVG